MNKALKSGGSPKSETAITTELAELTARAGEYLDKSKSDATKRAYTSDWRIFTTWTAKHRRRTLPATAETVALFITDLADSGRAASTISRVLTSISQAHKIAGHASPTRSPEVTEVYKGIRREKGTAQKRAKPLVLPDLKKVLSSIRPSFLGRRDTALLIVGWAGALRRSEIVALDREDIDFVDQGMILTIRKSKTDQEKAGYKLGIPFAREDTYCPVKKLAHWLELARITAGPIFYSIVTTGKKFHAEIDDPKRLSAKFVNAIIKKRIQQAGINPAGYSGHSLRAGFITTAAKMQVPEHMIQLHTRHRSSKVLRAYIREGNLFESNPMGALL